MHTGDGASGTPTALNTLIPRLKNMGYRFVTLSQLLNLTPLPSTGGATYTVKAGDTLSQIALRHNVNLAQLIALNNINNPNLISIGEPSPTESEIRKGLPLAIVRRLRQVLSQWMQLPYAG